MFAGGSHQVVGWLYERVCLGMIELLQQSGSQLLFEHLSGAVLVSFIRAAGIHPPISNCYQLLLHVLHGSISIHAQLPLYIAHCSVVLPSTPPHTPTARHRAMCHGIFEGSSWTAAKKGRKPLNSGLRS